MMLENKVQYWRRNQRNKCPLGIFGKEETISSDNLLERQTILFILARARITGGDTNVPSEVAERIKVFKGVCSGSTSDIDAFSRSLETTLSPRFKQDKP